MYNLYFINKFNEKVPLGEFKTEKAAQKEIVTFCDNHFYSIPYIRNWADEKGIMWYDVGSHSEFFTIEVKENV